MPDGEHAADRRRTVPTVAAIRPASEITSPCAWYSVRRAAQAFAVTHAGAAFAVEDQAGGQRFGDNVKLARAGGFR